MTTQENIRSEAMATVNRILDLAGIDVVKRQEINDQCDDILYQTLLNARLDENRKWAEGELSIYGDDDELDALTHTDIQNIIKVLADMHIAHLKGEKSEVNF